MATTTVNLPIHEHPLFPSARYMKGECAGCHVNDLMYGGYFCNEPYCYVWFHKECAEAPAEINHSSHPQHPLLLTSDSRDGPCDLCGQKLLPPCYSCSTCECKVDLTCGMKPSPPAIEHPLCHDHPVVFLKIREEKVSCVLCKESIEGPSYSCLECDVYFHVDCVHLSKEVNHPCHSIHPLKLIASESLTDDAEKSCLLCARKIPAENLLCHCSICNFTSCLGCTKNPPPLVIENIKTHKHPLTVFPRRISCICDVCGEKCECSPYVCLQCDFVTERICIDLPRVININRHDHRIHFTHHLGAGYSSCGVCHKKVSQYKGAYSCSVCPNYAVHTTCAVSWDVWDGVELEGTPEITEDISPFKVVGDNLICHFSHDEHPLKLYSWDDVIHDERIGCAACIHPVGFDSIYCCEKCPFMLHEKCANLPMKKRLVFGTRPYTLMKGGTGAVYCELCGILSGGFRYISQYKKDVDVHCGSLNEPLVHDGHPKHPLYFAKMERHLCDGCEKSRDDYMLRCEDCDFDLCLYCATLPEKIWHRNDGHPLTLCCGEKEKASGKYWCDICERELDPSIWFYTCSDCGVTLHAQCVLGDFSRLILGAIIGYEEKQIWYEVVPNNHNTRPLCIQCHSRCKVSVILKKYKEDNEYICSRSCLSSYLGEEV